MKLSSRARREWRIILWLSLGCAVISACFGYAVGDETPRAAMNGIINSLVIATPILLFEVKWQRLALLRRLRRQPLLVYFGFRVLFYVIIIVGGMLLSVARGAQAAFDDVFFISVGFAVTMSVITNLVFQMGQLLGFGTLKSLLAGRYVQPKLEQKAFLLIDMKNSTGLAERLGPLSFHELLNAFFRDVADAALECGAEIHKYVGDEAILTWPKGRALSDGECLACPFVTRDFIAANGKWYRARFGIMPQFRAALHYGEIVAGEIGDVRREIAYVGDTLNVAARLLEAAKDLGRDILVSTDLLKVGTLPSDIHAQPLPTLEVRGRAAPLGVSALERLSSPSQRGTRAEQESAHRAEG
jgi:adenylate cyclase